MTAMRQSHSRIYLAGHTGLVGGAILRDLRTRHYQQVITRTHADSGGYPRQLGASLGVRRR